MSDPIRLGCSVSQLKELLQQDKFFQIIMGTTLFRGIAPWTLPLTLLEEICDVARVEKIENGKPIKIEPLTSENSALFEIISGYVKIQDRRQHPNERTSKDVKPPPALLAWRVPGELLGDFQLVNLNEIPKDYLVTTDPCELLSIKTTTVRKIAAYDSRIYLNIAENLASKALKARVRAQILRLPTVECMVAKLFLELLDERKTDPSIRDYQVVNGTFHVDEIAAFLGCGVRSTQKAISKLNKAKLINHYEHDQTGRYYIRDKARLISYIDLERVAAKDRKRHNNSVGT
jgi:CRP-like cAMP-binding protein